MVITVNGKETEVAEGLSVLGLLESKGIAPDTVVVELNRDIVTGENFGTTMINDGDHLEVLRFVGGG
ncbi:sulfur carrier protein ThiS [Pseudodesulfovibrio sp. zrk46]|uniref:sulfur carrier protein ThiS n=1 Tax=Pseudodesulfovibrio sp. zrk46 TaxID=2725288 RepID=UPI0014495A2D|nr:sulfur carrier protein ThiS [Pseudodesulfovibrio sp. zrk46]QJB54917.1 sulfur carrier protein ThiS [Pseudodesulfovibrio sp. zrk46]